MPAFAGMTWSEMEILKLSILISLEGFIGFNILYLVTLGRGRLRFPEKMALSYGLGLGFISLEMFIFYILKMKFDLASIFLPWTALVFVNTYICRRARGAQEPALPIKDGGFSRLGAFIAILLGIEVSYAIFRALVSPIEAYDALSIYATKAKIFYLARSIPPDFFTNIGRMFPHPEYPLNTPLIETITYLALGRLNDQLVKLVFPLYFISILTMLYFGIRDFASKTYAVIFTFLLASVPQFNNYAVNGYLDIVLSYYVFASFLFLYRWLKEGSNTGLLVISAVMAGLGIWTKNEGAMYCVINIFLIFWFGRRPSRAFLYAAITALVVAPWLWVRVSTHIPVSDIDFKNFEPCRLAKHLNRLWPILNEYQKQFFGPKKWNLVWIVFLLTFAAKIKRAFSGNIMPITLSILAAFMGYSAVYMISGHGITWHLSTTVSRFFIHFLPILVYWLANMLKDEVRI